LILTHIGEPTVLIEVDGWRRLTDPTFDPAGGRHTFAWERRRPGCAGVAVMSTPAPHGPPLSRPIIGDVVGFLRVLDAHSFVPA